MRVLFVIHIAGCLAFALCSCGGAPPPAREAQHRLEIGDLAGAQTLADAAMRDYPQEPVLWSVRVRVDLARRENARAVSDYEEYRKLRHRDDRGLLRIIALTTLWQSLSAPSPDVRAAAILAAERLDEGSLFDEVTRHLGDEDAVVRATAAAATIHSHPDAPAVLTAALSGDSSDARAVAITALGKKVGKVAAADIRGGLSDRDAAVRDAACAALGPIAEDEDLVALARLATTDPVPTVRASAIRALIRPHPAAARAVAQRGLADPYLGARIAAADLLHAFGTSEIARLRTLTSAQDPFLAVHVAALLRGAGGIEVVRAAAQATDWPVRSAAMNALGGPIADVALALTLGDDPEPRVRLAAARALVRLRHPKDAVRIFVAALGSQDESVRLDAAMALARDGIAGSVETLGQLASSAAAPGVRIAALNAVPSATPMPGVVITGVADPAPIVRVAAAEKLLRLLAD
jgi:HEAT repeat protein